MSSTPSRSRLGRGLSSLLGQPVAVDVPGGPLHQAASPAELPADEVVQNADPDRAQSAAPHDRVLRLIAVTDIAPNRFQPRQTIAPAALDGLAASIRTSGVMQPVAVRPTSSGGGGADRYELIAGERRWRAAQLAGLSHVPAIVSDISDREAAEWALVENVQREDLNAVDRAHALRGLAERFNVSHAELAERLGLERSTVTNLIRLCELEPAILELVASGTLSAGHGKALLARPSGPGRIDLARRAAAAGWSVRRLENAARAGTGGTTGSTPTAHPRGIALADVERQLSEYLSTKVHIKTDRSGRRGRITLDFFDLDHFDALMTKIGARLRS